MNRQIEFRGKTVFNCIKRCDGTYEVPCGTFVYGSLIKNKMGGDMIHVCGYGADGSGFEYKHLVDSDTVGQFTGIRDKNGRKIFEGDVVSVNHGKKRERGETDWKDNLCYLEVTFKNGAFNVAEYECCTDLLEVVGTIYDKPTEK